MPVPKTNLFKGDRVRLTKRYLTALKLRNLHTPTNRYSRRIGTIVSDTLDPSYDCVVVWWDDCLKPVRRDRGYMPQDLELVEEEDNEARIPQHVGAGSAAVPAAE